MDETKWERGGAASGLAAVVVGGAAAVFERGPLTVNDSPATVVEHVTRYHSAMLVQSMVFLAGAAIYLWYLGSLRTFLSRAEGGTGRLSAVAFGAGTVWVALNMVAQAFQIGAVASPRNPASPALIGTMNAVFSIAALPLATMMAAVTVVSVRYRAFPIWLAWLAAATAGSQFLLWLGTAVTTGPLAPDGWLSYALYPVFVVWLIPAAFVMIRRAGSPPRPPDQGHSGRCGQV